jgi:hypothetical protein
MISLEEDLILLDGPFKGNAVNTIDLNIRKLGGLFQYGYFRIRRQFYNNT